MSWRDRAACIGAPQELFFGDHGCSYTEGRALCARCPVSNECLDYAVETWQPAGLWGGTLPRQRARIRTDKPITVECVECGTETRQRRPNVLTCSQKCAYARHQRIQNDEKRIKPGPIERRISSVIPDHHLSPV